MKNQKEPKAVYDDNNSVTLSGSVTFIRLNKTNSIADIGLFCKYKLNDKEFSTSPIIKVFDTTAAENDIKLTDIEKGDHLGFNAHFSTSKYQDKFYTNLVADSIFQC